MKVKDLKKLIRGLNDDAFVYVQNQDAECFPSCHILVDDEGNVCVTLFDVEQDESVWGYT